MRIKIDNKSVGDREQAFIVAELSANHNQDLEIAVKTIEAMKNSGADAVKLQTYTPDTITLRSDKRYFQVNQGTIWDGTTLHKLYGTAYTPWQWHAKLQQVAKKLGLVFFSSPFDKSSVDFLTKLKVPAFKVASFEITDIPLIKYIAKHQKPMIISTGIATLQDIHDAVSACKQVGNNKIILLKCTSAYPSPLSEMNILTIPDMKKRFKTLVGLSDHSFNIHIPSAAVALGAKLVEKHFILDRKIGGPDSSFSLEPQEFAEMVKTIREVEESCGKVTYELTPTVKKTREYSRSLFTTQEIKKGENFTEENIRSVRPAFGLAPKFLPKILGKKAKRDIEAFEPLSWEMVDKS